MVKSVDLDQILCSRGTFYPNVLKFVYYSEITSRILTVAYYKTTMFTCETHGIFVGILIIEYQSPISDPDLHSAVHFLLCASGISEPSWIDYEFTASTWFEV